MTVNLVNYSSVDNNQITFFENLPVICDKVGKVFFCIVVGAAIGAALGTPFGATIAGAVIGGAAGLIFAAVIWGIGEKAEARPLGKVPEKATELESLEGKAGLAYKRIQAAFLNRSQLEAAHDVHAIHNDVTLITDVVRDERPDLEKIWRTFLRTKKHVVFLNGTKVPLNFAREIKRLEGCFPDLQVQRLSSNLPLDDIVAITDIMNECFSKGEIGTRSLTVERTRGMLQKNHWIAIRDGLEGPILGVLMYIDNLDCTIHVGNVGRRADAARLGIGEKLFEELFKREVLQCTLNVRKSNRAAIALYDKLGFKKVGVLSQYYSFPREDAFVMERKTTRA